MKTILFDKKSLIVNGKRELIFSGAVHYPRSTPALWPRLLRESRRAGLNTIETYVFWEGHEPQEGQYNFAGRHDLRRFLDLCRREGLYAILRIGPYVCAETNFGGLPWWLITKPGMVTRTWNAPFLSAMERWVRRLMAEIGDCQITRGGPVILAQMENEYGNVRGRYSEGGERYLAWCVSLGRAAGIEVPLIMCEGAPQGVIATLNGFSVWSRVESLRAERGAQPMLWTEAWTGWYDTWGEPHHLRKVEDIAYETLRFFGVGGTGVNYYMWHGGTNFGRDAMFLQATSYDFDAPLDEFGLPTAKSERLGALHACLRRHADFFLKGRRARPQVLVPGQLAQNADGVVAYPYRLAGRELAVVVNGNDWPKTVTTRGLTLTLPNHAGAILLGRGRRFKVVYRSWDPPAGAIARTMVESGKPLRWRMAEEPLPPARGTGAAGSFAPVSLPHNMLPATRDETDYGWYRAEFRRPRAGLAVIAGRVADRVSVWVNGRYAGTAPERLQEDRPRAPDFDFALRVPVGKGKNTLHVLVHAIGMIKGDWMINAPQSEEKKGLLAPLTIDGRRLDAAWDFAPGLCGERVGLPDSGRPAPLRWMPLSASGGPLRWYSTRFQLTARDLADRRPWAIDIGALSKGCLWVNGQSLGRYWQIPAIDARRSRYTSHPHLINTGYDQPTQRFYHLPPDWLQRGPNRLVVLEENGARPENVSLVRRQ